MRGFFEAKGPISGSLEFDWRVLRSRLRVYGAVELMMLEVMFETGTESLVERRREESVWESGLRVIEEKAVGGDGLLKIFDWQSGKRWLGGKKGTQKWRGSWLNQVGLFIKFENFLLWLLQLHLLYLSWVKCQSETKTKMKRNQALYSSFEN